MSAIFLSHSSQDNPVAIEIAGYLRDLGHRSLFLDFDPENGIPPGRNWEQELYRRLRACRAAIVLCSEHSMASKWVFAEITHARALGKHLFPVKIGVCELPALLQGVQHLDLTGDRTEALHRLARGLREEAGLDAREMSDWDDERAPYPGLIAFTREDAGVFFGRDPEIDEGLARLRHLQRFGGARMLLVLGASGSGKSSLLRAGLLPNLELERKGWLVVPPFRPMADPFPQMAEALGEAFAEHQKVRDSGEVHAKLVAAAAADPVGGDALEQLLQDLRVAAGRRAATVLLAIDQLEELLTSTDPAEAARFLALLRALTAEPTAPLILLGTLRSDYLDRLQQHGVASTLPFETLLVGPMPSDRWVDIIEKPAEKAGVQLGPGLVPAMVQDTATEDALPLLAFTLHELWERFGRDGVLELGEYRDGLGGLAGSVARVAESVFAAQRLSSEEVTELRRAFSSVLVRVDEKGNYVRRTARWSEVPQSIHGVLERFVEKRLLVSRPDAEERELEVAHETLFRSWDRLRSWLDEDREFLVWRRRLTEAIGGWTRAGKDRGALLRGVPLGEAKGWLERRSADLEEAERAFVTECIEADTQQRRRQQLYLGALATAGCVVLLLIGMSLVQRARVAEQFWRSALLAKAAAEPDTLAASLLLSELLGAEEPPGGTAVARRLADHAAEYLPLALFQPDGGAVVGAAFTTSGVWVASAAQDGTVQLWQVDHARDPIRLQGSDEPVLSAAFSPDGARIVTASAGGTVRLWRVADGSAERVLDEVGQAAVVEFSPDGRRVAGGLTDGSGRLWRVDAPGPPTVLPSAGDVPVSSIAFSRNGRSVVVASLDGTIRLWNPPRSDAEVVRVGEGGIVWSAALDPEGRRIIVAGPDSAARLLHVSDDTPPQLLNGHGDLVVQAAFGPEGRRVATGSNDGTVRLWSLDGSAEPLVLRGHRAPVVRAEFSPDGARLLTLASDGTVRLWAPDSAREPLVLSGHGREVMSAAFSPDGRQLLSASEDGTLRLWRTDGAAEPVASVNFGSPVASAVFGPDSTRVAAALADGTVRVCGSLLTGCRTGLRHGAAVTRVAFSPDGSRIVAAANDGEVRIGWSDGSREPLTLGTHEAFVRTALFDRAGARLLTASGDGSARIWSLDGKREPVVLRHRDAVLSAAFSHDGSRVVTAAADSSARLWSADGREMKVFPHTDRVRHAAFSPDDKRVVTASDDGRILLWHTDGEREPIQLGNLGVRVRSLEFSPDGRQVLTAAQDTIVRLWPTDGRGEAAVLRVGAPVQSAAYSPDGTRVVTASDDGRIRLWRAEWNVLLQYLRGATAACLTRAQRTQLLNESREVARRNHLQCEQRYGLSASQP